MLLMRHRSLEVVDAIVSCVFLGKQWGEIRELNFKHDREVDLCPT